jgi:ATP-dependent Clp protease protease subunit
MRQSKDQILFDVHNHCINLSLRDIYLHSFYDKESDGEPGVEYRMATTFTKNMYILDQNPFKPILVHLHSVGGCWWNGMAIYDVIQYATSYITMLCYAQASSMSGVILQSARCRVMMPDAHFMMHHGVIGAENHPMAVKSAVDFEAKMCNRMLQIFARRAVVGPFFKKRKSTTVQAIYNFFDKKLKDKIDWYLDAEETVFFGLADFVLGHKQYPTVASLRET